jgi:pantetheine-phosphate adenylyltransferase
VRKAIYAGSFDPITLGHLDIIERISAQFDEIIVLVADSLSKDYLFQVNERVKMIQESVSAKNVRVASTDGLLVDYAKHNKISTIVRGIRAISDFEYEFAMANINRTLAPEIETMIVFTRPEYSFLASRMVKEVASHGGPLDKMVPPNVDHQLKLKKEQGAL